MICEVKPSEIYRGLDKSEIDRFLRSSNYRVDDFKVIRDGDVTLFYNNDGLSIGEAMVIYAGYVRFTLAPTAINDSWIDRFWE